MRMATRKLTVTNLHPITSGVGNYGPWTLYGVDAVTEDGHAITDTLKTFQELPIGELIDVEVEKKESEQYGTEYTIKKPKGARYALTPPKDDGYEMLREMVQRLADRVAALEQGVPAYTSPARTDVPAEPVQQPVASGGVATDDIPF